MSTSSGQRPPNLEEFDRNFLLALYDKLWENIVHKENRLWTFLAVYGGAIGFSVGTAVDASLRVEAALVLLVLTYWAAEIIIDADWWSVRNRLMVRGIELRAKDAIAGVVPARYNTAGYRGESLNESCLLVFTTLGLIVFWLALHDLYAKATGLKGPLLGLLYALFVIALARCGHVREKRIEDYFDALIDVDNQDHHRERLQAADIYMARRKDRWGKSWRIQLATAFSIATAVVVYFFHVELAPFRGGLFVALLVLAICYGMHSCAYASQEASNDRGFYGFSPIGKFSRKSERDKEAAQYLVLTLLMFACTIAVVGILIAAIGHTPAAAVAPPKPPSAAGL